MGWFSWNKEATQEVLDPSETESSLDVLFKGFQPLEAVTGSDATDGADTVMMENAVVVLSSTEEDSEAVALSSELLAIKTASRSNQTQLNRLIESYFGSEG